MTSVLPTLRRAASRHCSTCMAAVRPADRVRARLRSTQSSPARSLASQAAEAASCGSDRDGALSVLACLVVGLHHAQQVRQAAALAEAEHAVERAWHGEVRRRREVRRRKGAEGARKRRRRGEQASRGRCGEASRCGVTPSRRMKSVTCARVASSPSYVTTPSSLSRAFHHSKYGGGSSAFSLAGICASFSGGQRRGPSRKRNSHCSPREAAKLLYSHICLRRLPPDMRKEWKQMNRIGAIPAARVDARARVLLAVGGKHVTLVKPGL